MQQRAEHQTKGTLLTRPHEYLPLIESDAGLCALGRARTLGEAVAAVMALDCGAVEPAEDDVAAETAGEEDGVEV